MRWLALIVALTACAQERFVSYPIVGITDKGEELHGSVTVSLDRRDGIGEFYFPDGTRCEARGPAQTTITVSSTYLCNDGRMGLAVGTVDSLRTSAYGTITFDDGTKAKILAGTGITATDIAQFLAQNRP